MKMDGLVHYYWWNMINSVNKCSLVESERSTGSVHKSVGNNIKLCRGELGDSRRWGLRPSGSMVWTIGPFAFPHLSSSCFSPLLLCEEYETELKLWLLIIIDIDSSRQCRQNRGSLRLQQYKREELLKHSEADGGTSAVIRPVMRYVKVGENFCQHPLRDTEEWLRHKPVRTRVNLTNRWEDFEFPHGFRTSRNSHPPADNGGRVLHTAASCSPLWALLLMLEIAVLPPGCQTVYSCTALFRPVIRLSANMKMVLESWTDTQSHVKEEQRSRWSPSPWGRPALTVWRM